MPRLGPVLCHEVTENPGALKRGWFYREDDASCLTTHPESGTISGLPDLLVQLFKVNYLSGSVCFPTSVSTALQTLNL